MRDYLSGILSDKFDNIFFFAQPFSGILGLLIKALEVLSGLRGSFGSQKRGKRIRSVKMITGIFELSFHLLAAPSEVKITAC